MKKIFRTGIRLFFVSVLVTHTAAAVTTRGLIGNWDLKPNPPMKVVLDAGTSFSGNLWASTISTTTDEDGETVWTKTGYLAPFSSQYIRVDPSKTYRLSGRFRSAGETSSKLYFGVETYGEKKQRITSSGAYRRNGANDGTILDWNDTTITTAESLTDWAAESAGRTLRIMGFWYDGDTTKLPNSYMYSSAYGATHRGAYLSVSGTTINLSVAIPTSISNNFVPGVSIVKNLLSGAGSYLYSAASSKLIPTSWTTYSGTMTGAPDWGTRSSLGDARTFRPGTRYVRIILLLNYSQDENFTTEFDDIVFEEVHDGGSFLYEFDSAPITTGVAQQSRHPAKNYGATFSTGRSGEPRGAMEFDGVDDYLEIQNSSIVGTDDFSVALWAREANIAKYTYLLSNGAGGGNNGFGFLTRNSTTPAQISFEVYPDDGTRNAANFSLSAGHDNQWHHYAATVDRDGYLKVYLDGTYAAQTDISADVGKTIDNQNLFVGSTPFSIGHVEGSISDVKIYNRVLTQSEISELADELAPIVDTERLNNLDSAKTAPEGKLFWNWVTKKIWRGASDGSLETVSRPDAHKTSAEIATVHETNAATAGLLYYDTDEKRLYWGQSDGSLLPVSD